MMQKQYDLGFSYFGSGIVVYNRKEEVNYDYKVIAYINHNRQVKFYEDLPAEIKNIIINYALTANPKISMSNI